MTKGGNNNIGLGKRRSKTTANRTLGRNGRSREQLAARRIDFLRLFEENRCCRRAQEANRGKRERLGGGIDKQAAPKGYKYKEEGEGEKRRRRKNIEAD